MKILGLGAVLVDEVSLLPSFPLEDSKIEILDSYRQVGGPVPTALRMLSSMGVDTFFVGKIGDDEKADFIENKLLFSDVSVEGLIKQSDANSGFSQVWVNNQSGARTLAYSSGGLDGVEVSQVKNFSNIDLLHIDGREPSAAMSLIKKHKETTLISIDTGNFRESTLELLSLVDIMIMPKRFAVEMFGENTMQELVLKMHDKFPTSSMIVITDGQNGSVCWHGGKVYAQKAFEVSAVDTNGAGDIHSAGIIYGVLKGLSVEDTLELAAALAGLKCEKISNNILPSLDEAQKLIQNKNITA